MLLYSCSMLAGIVLLVWGAERMVVGAAVTARNLGVAPLLVGLTVVGFATSAPEILVSATAALKGSPSLAIGNAIGSNIANIGLVAAVGALIHPLIVHSETLRRELPVMVAVSILPVILFPDLILSRTDGLFLLAALVGFLYWIIRLGRKTSGHDPIEAEYAAEIPADMTQTNAVANIVIGLLILVAGSNALVWGGQNLASVLGVSDLVLGVTVVAIGTSLPELAVTIVSVRKGEYGLALGNVIGSNAFNMLAVIGTAAVIAPTTLEMDALLLHMPVMLAFTVLFFFIAYNYSETIRVGRLAGIFLLLCFISYHSYLVYQNL